MNINTENGHTTSLCFEDIRRCSNDDMNNRFHVIGKSLEKSLSQLTGNDDVIIRWTNEICHDVKSELYNPMGTAGFFTVEKRTASESSQP